MTETKENVDVGVVDEDIPKSANADFRNADDEQKKLSLDNGDYTFKFHADHVHIYKLGGQPIDVPKDLNEFAKLLKSAAGAMCRVTLPESDAQAEGKSDDPSLDRGKVAYDASKDMTFKPE